METKLTLKLDKKIIEQAKIFAKSKNLSLSKIVEHYLYYLLKNKPKDDYSMLVNELSGIITLPDNYNIKDDYTEYLLEKNDL